MNGGYTTTPVEQWPEGLRHFLIIGFVDNLIAAIISPLSGQEFIQGTTVPWQAKYNGIVHLVGIPVSWTENASLDSSRWPVGNITIPSGYGTMSTVEVVIKNKRGLGTERNQHDEIIFQEAEEFGIDPDLLKSLIHQESLNFDTKLFHKEAYRYEPCIDYNYFSGTAPSIGMSQEPYSHYTIQGKDLAGNPIPQGDKLPSTYKQKVKQGALTSKWNLKFDDNDPDLTLTELWEDNNDIQNWDVTCGLQAEQRNFTVQFLVTGSYGLTQILYQTAIERDFNKDKPNRSPLDLFDPETAVHYGAKQLKRCYDLMGSWRDALTCYNPDTKYPIKVYDELYLSPLYDLIEE